MAVETLQDGKRRVSASRLHFFLAGVTSAGVGAGLSLAFRHLFGWSFLSWSVATVFGFFTLRALFRGFVYAPLLSVVFSSNAIEGPSFVWLSRSTASVREIDWMESHVGRRHVVLYHAGSRVVALRLAWYTPLDREFIREELERLRLSSKSAE